MKMTSTSFNIGFGEGGRISGRVLRPPGGGHTDIFGGEPEPPRTGRRAAPNAAALAVSGEEPSIPESTEAPTQNGQSPELIPEPIPEPQVAEPIPAEPSFPAPSPQHESPKKEIAEPRPQEAPKRVRVPPGGFSSGLW